VLPRLGLEKGIYAAVLFDSTNSPERMRAIAENISRGVRNVILDNKK